MEYNVEIKDEAGGYIDLVYTDKSDVSTMKKFGLNEHFYSIVKITTNNSKRKDAGYRILKKVKEFSNQNNIQILVNICNKRSNYKDLETWYKMNGFIPTLQERWFKYIPRG